MRDGNIWRSRKKPRRYVEDRGCKQKDRFSDEPQARAAALYAIENPRRANEPIDRLWVYRCPHCFGWHMTSKPHERRWLVERVKVAA